MFIYVGQEFGLFPWVRSKVKGFKLGVRDQTPLEEGQNQE